MLEKLNNDRNVIKSVASKFPYIKFKRKELIFLLKKNKLKTYNQKVVEL